MTTIAATKYMMAADTKITVGESWFYGPKMYRIGRAVVGCSGDSTAIEKFLAWYRKPRMRQDECEEATFFLILACVCGVLFLIFG